MSRVPEQVRPVETNASEREVLAACYKDRQPGSRRDQAGNRPSAQHIGHKSAAIPQKRNLVDKRQAENAATIFIRACAIQSLIEGILGSLAQVLRRVVIQKLAERERRHERQAVTEAARERAL